ncbi:transposase, partial [Anaerosolibacter carboniphilus]
MLTKSKDKQTSYEFVMLEELVKEDHLLRKIDKYIDFSFIYGEVEDLYSSDNGRPSIDPVVLFKMTLLQYLYG